MKNIGKKVYIQNSGEYFGYILDVVISQDDLRKVGYYVVDDKNETEFFLAQSDVVFLGNAVFVNDNQAFQFVSNVSKSLIGKEVFDDKGEFYGCVCDIEFLKDKVNKIKTNLCELPVKFLKKIDGDCVFVSFSRKRYLTKRNEKVGADAKKELKLKQNEEFSKIPQKVSLAASYYVGKSSKSDIFGYNNERILQKNVKITKAIFENIKKHNKLNELFFFLNN